MNPALFPSANLSFRHEEKCVSSQCHAMLPSTHWTEGGISRRASWYFRGLRQEYNWSTEGDKVGSTKEHESQENTLGWQEARTGFYTFIDRASRYKFLVITNLMHFFMYLFISCFYTFRASQRSSSGDRIVLIHRLVWLVCVSDCLVCWHTKQSLTQTNHTRQCINTIRSPDDERCDARTCRDMK
jgi:hypothetical protein